MCLVSVPHLQVLNYNRAKWYFITSRFVEFFMNWKFWLYTEEEYTKILGWDVVRPKSSVDK